MSSEIQRDLRLGSMMVHMELLRESDLNEASQLAVELGLPLGKVLVMSDFITDEQLAALVQAQSMLKDNLLTVETARRAIDILSTRRVPWADALKLAGWMEPQIFPTNKLGDLLRDAGIVPTAELDMALQAAELSGLPLGRVLSASGRVSEQVLYACLNAQVLLRDGRITRDQALKALKAAHMRQTTIEQVLIDEGAYQPPPKVRIKLGEMFVVAGLLPETTIMEVIERGLVTQEPIGQVLVKERHISQEQLDTALRLQELVDQGTLNPINCCEALRQINARKISIEIAVQEATSQRETQQQHTQLSLAGFLKVAGILTEEDIHEAFKRSMENPQILGRILVMTGFLTERALDLALESQNMLRNNKITEEQAIIAINYCLRMNCSLDQATRDLGWVGNPRSTFTGMRRTQKEEVASTAANKALEWLE